MENFEWLAPLKTAVLIMFFMTFASIIAITLTSRSNERWGRLPLLGQEEDEVKQS
jgi:hypothetical protein